jgi:hypothetical protein
MIRYNIMTECSERMRSVQLAVSLAEKRRVDRKTQKTCVYTK